MMMMSYELHLQHDELGNAPHLLGDVDAGKIEHGQYTRASCEAPCQVCGQPLWRHGSLIGATWLIKDCAGDLWKP